MPELPEVETTRRGLLPHVEGRTIEAVTVRDARLRWPVPPDLPQRLTGRVIQTARRRAKYLLFACESGTLIVHLGMSGSLRVVDRERPPARHDHVDLRLETGRVVRYNDPRRFGAVLWTGQPPEDHPLLARLGAEPLTPGFDGGLLHGAARSRPGPVKSLIMDSHVVVGVGNIYASEALFRAGIHPTRPARRIARTRYDRLAETIREVLTEAIAQGGTTLRDFVGSDGRPGYFARRLAVYGRSGEPCPGCGAPIRRRVLANRATYFCPACQR